MEDGSQLNVAITSVGELVEVVTDAGAVPDELWVGLRTANPRRRAERSLSHIARGRCSAVGSTPVAPVAVDDAAREVRGASETAHKLHQAL